MCEWVCVCAQQRWVGSFSLRKTRYHFLLSHISHFQVLSAEWSPDSIPSVNKAAEKKKAITDIPEWTGRGCRWRWGGWKVPWPTVTPSCSPTGKSMVMALQCAGFTWNYRQKTEDWRRPPTHTHTCTLTNKKCYPLRLPTMQSCSPPGQEESEELNRWEKKKI